LINWSSRALAATLRQQAVRWAYERLLINRTSSAGQEETHSVRTYLPSGIALA
jgi:hypothetical protein